MKKTFFLAALLCLSLYTFHAQGTDKQQSMSYTEFITTVEEKLPDLMNNEANLKLTENILFKAQALHDVTFNASANGFGTKYYWDSAENQTTDYSIGYGISGDVTTKLPSGTQITAGGGFTQTYSRSVGSAFGSSSGFLIPYDQNNSSNTYVPNLKFSVNQPLIYNYFGFLDRYNKKDAKQKVEIQKLTKEELDKQVMLYYKTVYFRAIQYQRTLRNLRRSIINAQRLEEQTLAKLRSGLAENDDLQRVRTSVYSYQDAYASTEDGYKQLQNDLAWFIDVDNIVFDDSEFDQKVEYSMNFNFEKVTFEETRKAKIIALQRENMELSQKAAKNQALPSLNLFGTLDVKFNYPEYESEEYGGGTSYTKPTYKTVEFTGGVNFSYSLGNHLQRGNLKDIELNLQILDNNFENDEKNFTRSMDNFLSQIENLKKRIGIKERMIRSLQSQYQTELAKYNQARLEMRNLLDTDSSIFSQQSELLQLKLQLIIFQYDYNNLVN